MRQLAPGVYDDDGTLHLDLPAMLEAAGYADTPENRDTLERAAHKIAAQSGIPVEPATPAPDNDGWRCPRCGSPRWVAASLTGPVSHGGRAIRQCIPCGHYSADDVPERTKSPSTAPPNLADVTTRDLATELVVRLKVSQPNSPVLSWRARYGRAIADVLDAVELLDSIPGALDAVGR